MANHTMAQQLFAKVLPLPFAFAYLLFAVYVAWKIQFASGSLYTAILAGIVCLPWSILIPRDLQSPLMMSIVTLTGAAANTTIGWCIISRIPQRKKLVEKKPHDCC